MPGRREELEAERQAAARRVLDRAQEGEVVGSSAFARAADRLVKHFGAADRNQDDAAELWGARVGRLLGLAAFVALAIYLVVSYGPQ
jgi:hypothetical protein